MLKVNRFLAIILLSLFAIAMGSCGGGGDSQPPPPASDTGIIRGSVFADTSAGLSSLVQASALKSLQKSSTVAVQNADVKVESKNFKGTVKTDANGKFEIEVPKGHYNLIAETVRQDGKKFTSLISADVQGGDVVEMSSVIIKEAGAIYGIATLSDKSPGYYKGIVVYIESTGLFALTDENGAYAFPGVPAGTFTVKFAMVGYTGTEVSNVVVEIGKAKEVSDVMLYATAQETVSKGIVNGSIMNADTILPISGALVSVKGLGVSSVSMDDGSYKMAVDPGTYAFLAVADGYSLAEANAQVVKGQTTKVDMLLQPSLEYGTGIVRGTVVSSGGNIAGAVIVSSPPRGQTYTDTTGAFTLSLPVGSYSLSVVKGGYDGTTVFVSLTAGMDLNIGSITILLSGSGGCVSSEEICDGLDNDCDGLVDEGCGGDTTAPSLPSNLIADVVSSNQINLSWSPSSDDVGVAGYKLYRGGVYLKSVTTTSTSDTGLSPSTQYCYTVSAYDFAGNESAKSTEACATTLTAPDTQAPTQPTGLTATAISSTQINLSWTASTDNVGVAGYKVYRSGTYLKAVTTTSTSDTGLSPSTQYCYTVSAYDAAGNESTESAEPCATTLTAPDTQAPTQPTGLIATAISSTQINLSWSPSSDDVGVAGYKLYRGGVYLKSVTTTSTSDTGLSPSTQYCYTVSAYDFAGNESAKSTEACATTPSAPDTQAPTQPTGLTVTAISSTQINLSWTASTDNVGVAGYKVYRSGTYLKAVTTTSTSDTGLSASTQYCYSVTAYDAAGNESTESAELCATTQTDTGDVIIIF